MAVKTLTRRNAAQTTNLPAMIPSVLRDMPLGSIALGDLSAGSTHSRGKAGRKSKAGVHPAALAIESEIKMAMIGRLYFMGSLQLLSQCLQELGVSGPEQHQPTRQRAAWGSKTGRKVKRRKAHAKT